MIVEHWTMGIAATLGFALAPVNVTPDDQMRAEQVMADPSCQGVGPSRDAGERPGHARDPLPVPVGSGVRAASPRNCRAHADESSSDTLRLSGLRSGPVCNAGAGQVGRPPSTSICPSRSVLVRGMDTCEFDGAEIRCTWWGFEFDYHGASSGVPLVCVWERTLPSDEGNYDGVRRRNATTDTIEVQLPSDSGHLFHPAFEGFPRQLTAAWVPVQLTWDCSYQGRPAFSLAHRLIFSSSFR